MGEYRDLQILGVGKEPGGRFGKVLIAGSGKLSGDVECQEFTVPGAGKVEDGGLTVHGSISCHGACKVEGPVLAEGLSVHGAFSTEAGCEIRADAEILGSLKSDGPCVIGGLADVKGAVKTEQDFRGKTVKVSGVLKAEAGMKAESFEVNGVLKSEGDVQAERFRAEGPVTIDGELNAETVELQLSGESMIETIVGGSVRVKAGQENGGAQRSGFRIHLDLSIPFFGARKLNYDGGGNRPHLAATLIEADEIDLESTDCETVRGVNVRIGPECVIDRVEYSGSLVTDPNCSVGEKVKI
jgi:cytoskeletal protein CcmA (bactofilin family)